MYAVVGFCSPATIFSKLSSLAENVASASPATGTAKKHQVQQATLVEQAFAR